MKNYRGEKFNLDSYVNPDAYLITMKNEKGRTLKRLELPGLWNGGMAYWNTVFVELPLIVFNPVKTVNDLLRPEHLLGKQFIRLDNPVFAIFFCSCFGFELSWMNFCAGKLRLLPDHRGRRCNEHKAMRQSAEVLHCRKVPQQEGRENQP